MIKASQHLSGPYFPSLSKELMISLLISTFGQPISCSTKSSSKGIASVCMSEKSEIMLMLTSLAGVSFGIEHISREFFSIKSIGSSSTKFC